MKKRREENENASQLPSNISPPIDLPRDRSGVDRFAVGNYNNRKAALFITRHTHSSPLSMRVRNESLFAYCADGAMNDDRWFSYVYFVRPYIMTA